MVVGEEAEAGEAPVVADPRLKLTGGRDPAAEIAHKEKAWALSISH